MGLLDKSDRHSSKLAFETLECRTVMSADPVLHWNEVMLDALVADSYLSAAGAQKGPTATSRALAIVSAAVFDAVNSIDRSYYSYLTQVNAPSTASITAAVAYAAHDTLVALYPHFSATLDTELFNELATVTDPASKAQGSMVGKITAMNILAARQFDGFNTMVDYVVNTSPGNWQPDPLHPGQMALGPGWGSITPFTMTKVSQYISPAPPKMNSAAYATAFNEVKAYGGDGVGTPTIRSEEQTQIGIYWGYDGSPGLSTPPRLYNQIAAHIAVQQGNTVVQNSRMFAMVNLAMADAGVASWGTKYLYNVWRPVTGLQNGNLDGNSATVGDPNWHPLGAPNDNGGGTNFTPPFPAYTSGHATFGAATFKSLANFYGTDNIAFTFLSDEYNGITVDQHGDVRPAIPRSFTSFSQAAEENGQSRIYLGIHWAFDKTEGIKQGNKIADNLFRNYLQPMRMNHRMFTVYSMMEHVYTQNPIGASHLTKLSLPIRKLINITTPFTKTSDASPTEGLVVKLQTKHLKATTVGNPELAVKQKLLTLDLS